MREHTNAASSETDATVSIPRLRAALDGLVISSGDAAHDRARAVFAGGIDTRR